MHRPTTITRRRLLKDASGLAVLLSASPMLAACGSSGSGGTGSRTLRIGHVTAIDTLNPMISQTGYWTFVPSNAYLLDQVHPNTPLIPNFATTWSRSADGLTYTVKVRAGQKWSDGKSLTSRDVAFTVNLMVKYPLPTALLNLYTPGLAGAETPDDTTVIIHYKAPVAIGLSGFTQIPVLPEHFWSKYAVGNGSALATAKIGPGAVSGGPFRLAEYATNEIALLKPNPGYSGRMPHVNAIGFQQYTTATTMFGAVTGGSLDATADPTFIPPDSSTLTTSTHNTQFAPGMNWYFVGLNTNSKKPKHRELLNPSVRTALAHAIDKARIVTDVCYGHGQEGSTIIQPCLGKWRNSNLPPEGYDLERADHMLDSLGYRRGAGGIRVANGQPMSYSVALSSDIPGYDRLFQIVAQGWASVGVQIKGTPLDAAAMFTAISAPNVKYLSNDVHIWYWTGSYDPSTLLNTLTTAQIGGYSTTAFSDPTYDGLFTQQLHELDQSKRLTLVHQMQEIAYRMKPEIVLAYPNAFASILSKWRGITMTPVGYFPGTSRQWLWDAQS